MLGPFCTNCGQRVPLGDRFCPQCGMRRLPPVTAAPQGRRYWGLLWQVDPMNPPPVRDVRYTMIVAGIALLILGVLVLGVGALVGAALSVAGPSCPASGCAGLDVGSWFTWFGLPLLGVGVLLFVVGLWWGLKVPATTR